MLRRRPGYYVYRSRVNQEQAEVLKSDAYCSRLLSGFRMLLENSLLCDLTLVADNQSIRVHRAVMAATSDYFRALLTLDMKERSQQSVELKGVPLRGLKEIVTFAYTATLRCTYDNISDVLLAATHLQFTDAITLSCSYLVGLTNLTNCVDMYNLAEQFNLVLLKEKALTLILSHFDDISVRDEYLNFQARFLEKILGDDRLHIGSELDLFQLILKWINHAPSDRVASAAQLMSHIRFPLIPPADLVQIVMAEKLMKQDTECLELVFEANKYHMLPDKQPLLQTPRTKVRSSSPSLVMLDIDDDGPRVYDISRQSWGTLRQSRIETYHAQVCVLDNFMYVCGGIELYSSNNPVSARCYRYDPRFDTWAEITPMQEPRHHFTLVSYSNTIFAIGGYCTGLYKNVVEQYIQKENRWIKRASMDVRLSAAAAAELDGCVYVTGGQREMGISSHTWCYNINNDAWSSKPAMLQARMDHGMCSYAHRLFVFGGYDKNIIKAFDVNTVECFDTKSEQWSVVYEKGPKISGINSCLVDSRVYSIGGFTYDENKKRTEVWCYDIKANEWQVAARIPSPAMSLPCCALYIPRCVLQDITV